MDRVSIQHGYIESEMSTIDLFNSITACIFKVRCDRKMNWRPIFHRVPQFDFELRRQRKFHPPHAFYEL